MKTRGLLLDVEGVLVADKRYTAVESATAFVAAVRRAGRPLRLITNNTTDDRRTMLEKLHRAGFDFSLDELHTCTSAAVAHLKAVGARRCLVLGNSALRGIFAEAGFAVVEDREVDAVVVGLDTELTYQRLQLACDAVISRGARLVALHHNRLLTDAAGRPTPSVGAIASAIEYATRVDATVIGKPSPEYFNQALGELDLPVGEVLLVSDDPLSDLAGGKRLGMRTAFVLSGKYAHERVLDELPLEQRPDITVARIGDLLTEGGLSL